MMVLKEHCAKVKSFALYDRFMWSTKTHRSGTRREVKKNYQARSVQIIN